MKIINLRDHLKTHIPSDKREQPHICNWPECGKEFFRADELRLHMGSHNILKRHKCTKCNKEYMSSTSLKTHVKIKHSENSRKQMNRKKVKLKIF